MKKISETIIFFGSGPVAAKSLEAIAKKFAIELVITKPKPQHHKQPFPVIETAKNLHLQILTTEDKQDLVGKLKDYPLSSRLGLVIDYGIIVPKDIIERFELGIINSHFSLLPKYRGADPISYAILNGDRYSGVSLMQIVPALDEGPLLAQAKLQLNQQETSSSLTDRLIKLSNQLIEEILPKYLSGDIKTRPQPKQNVSYSHKLDKQDSVLDWSKPAVYLERQVRAFQDWPRSRTMIGKIPVIVTKAHVVQGKDIPGKIYLKDKQLGFYTQKDLFIIDELMPEGKKLMSASAFLNGYKIDTDN